MRYTKLGVGLLLAIITCMASYKLFAAESNSIKQIRNLYQDAKTKITEGKLLVTKVDYITNEKISEDIMEYFDFNGPICKLYWSFPDKKLIFAEVFKASSGMIRNEEYLFYPNGDLAFFYSKTTNAIDNKVTNEERYYYANKNLIRYITDSKTIDSNFSSEIINLSKSKMDNSAVLKKAFTIATDLAIKLR